MKRVNKKNILILTSIYPGNDVLKEFTPIVHFFTKEWVRKGHNVKVIHNVAYYPIFLYWVAFFFSKLIASITGTNVPTKRLAKEKEYVLEKVPVVRLPMFKKFPQGRFSKNVISKQVNKIIRELENNNFEPDYIIGHWGNPQLELIASLKEKYPASKTVLTMHDDGASLKELYAEQAMKMLLRVDSFGFRSRAIKVGFEAVFGKKQNTFMCYSGIPEKFIEEEFSKRIEGNLKSFLFVGTLIKRKYPEKIIDALHEVYGETKFSLSYIGEGQQSENIKSKVKAFNLEENIHLLGRVSRQEVWERMKVSDCFIMISKDEAYGLVYLEAMAAGCITIAAKDEGFDGVIEHGVNGFLCEAGNSNDLSKVLSEINNLSTQTINQISKNARKTAYSLTDKKAALAYLNNIEK